MTILVTGAAGFIGSNFVLDWFNESNEDIVSLDLLTYGQYVAEILSSDNKKQLYIPEGFAHGFLTLSETSEFLYKTTDFYHPKSERCILWNDKVLNINIPIEIEIKISSKDLLGKSFKLSELFV
jgi:dTDP-4-dehydrorhamnose 3,5-epimerase